MHRFLSFALLFLAGGTTDAPPDVIRVRIFEREAPTCIDVRSPESVDVHVRLGRPATLTDRSIQICSHKGALRVTSGNETTYARHLDIQSRGQVDVTAKRQGMQAETRTYPDHLTLSPDGDGLMIVNVTRLDPYVAGVIAKEYGLDDDEGTEAMAIVARTYALRIQDRRRDQPYDVVDNTSDQVYKGIGDATRRALTAANHTSGRVLTHNGQLVEAVYSASNGGHGADNDDVWQSAPISYLRGRPDPYDRVSPVHTWTARLDRNRVLDALTRTSGRQVTGWLIEDRTPDGRVRTITLLHGSSRSTIRGTQFRSAVTAQMGVSSVRSTLFDATRQGDSYVLEGKGFGHGVGMSQWGAHGMAKQGKSAEEILAFYYPGTRVEKRSGSGMTLADIPSPQEREESERLGRAPLKSTTSTQDERRIGWRR